MLSTKCSHPRKVDHVVKKIFEIIPENETNFRIAIQQLIMDFTNNPPEKMKYRGWSKIEEIIYKHIRDVEEMWKRQIIQVYQGIE